METIILVFFFTITAVLAYVQLSSNSTNPAKEFVKRASKAKKEYQRIYRDVLSKHVIETDNPREATFDSTIIRYYTFEELCDFLLGKVDDALRNYNAMDKTYQNKSAVKRSFLELNAILIEVETLKSQYIA